MVFDPHNDRLYVGHDDDGELWVIDPQHYKIIGRIAIPGAPELMAIDPQSHRLYLNIKPKNEVVAIDPGTRQDHRPLVDLAHQLAAWARPRPG